MFLLNKETLPSPEDVMVKEGARCHLLLQPSEDIDRDTFV